MKLWPYDSFEIDTQMTAEAIAAVLNDRIEPTKWFRWLEDHKTFQGTITRDGFKITRIINYRNSFLPIISGFLHPGPSGISVAIRMRLHPIITAFMFVWFGVALGIVAFIAALFGRQTEEHLVLLIPFGMLFFGWALMSGVFWFEAKKTKPILIEMFNGQLRREQSTPPYSVPRGGAPQE